MLRVPFTQSVNQSFSRWPIHSDNLNPHRDSGLFFRLFSILISVKRCRQYEFGCGKSDKSKCKHESDLDSGNAESSLRFMDSKSERKTFVRSHQITNVSRLKRAEKRGENETCEKHSLRLTCEWHPITSFPLIIFVWSADDHNLLPNPWIKDLCFRWSMSSPKTRGKDRHLVMRLIITAVGVGFY